MAVVICYLGMMCVGLAVNSVPVFLTTLSLDFSESGLTGEQLGRIGASVFAGIVLAIFVTGPLADRFGAKSFVVLGSALISGGLLALGLSRSYSMVLLSVFVMGLGAGTLDMLLSPIICALLPNKRAAAMNWLHACYCLGAVTTVVIESSLLQAGISWRVIAQLVAAAPALVAVAFATIRIPPLVSEQETRTPVRILINDGYFLIAILAIFLAGATELGMAQWLPNYAETTLGYSKWTGGAALLTFSLLMATGRLAAGWLGPRVDPIKLMVRSCWTAGALLIAASALNWPALALAACALLGLAVSPLWPSMLGVAADRFPHGGASMFCLLAAAGNFGGMFMPWVIGVVADRYSLRLGLLTATLCPLVMMLLLSKLYRIKNAAASLTYASPCDDVALQSVDCGSCPLS